MIRTGMAFTAVGLIALFGYFYATDSSGRETGDKAKSAAINVGDAVRDKGVAEMVELRLKSKFGLEATRFVHAYFNDGHALVYGLLPAATDLDAVIREAGEVPGVNSVEVMTLARPEYVEPFGSQGAAPLLDPEPAEAPETP